MPTQKFWLTRDDDGSTELWIEKPIRKHDVWMGKDPYIRGYLIDEFLFPNLKWSDEPIEVEINAPIEIEPKVKRY